MGGADIQVGPGMRDWLGTFDPAYDPAIERFQVPITEKIFDAVYGFAPDLAAGERDDFAHHPILVGTIDQTRVFGEIQ